MRYRDECRLIMLFHHFDSDPKAVDVGFETSFLGDTGARFKEEGGLMFVSGKMLDIFQRIATSRFGMDWHAYECEDLL